MRFRNGKQCHDSNHRNSWNHRNHSNRNNGHRNNRNHGPHVSPHSARIHGLRKQRGMGSMQHSIIHSIIHHCMTSHIFSQIFIPSQRKTIEIDDHFLWLFQSIHMPHECAMHQIISNDCIHFPRCPLVQTGLNPKIHFERQCDTLH